MRFAFVAFYLSSLVCGAQSLSGIIWEDSRYLSLPFKSDYGERDDRIPVRYSLKAYCPDVVNQKGFATSAGWAAAWYGMSIAESASCLSSQPEKITGDAFSPLFAYRVSNTQGDCETPVSLLEVLNILKESGTPRFKEFNDLCPLTIPRSTHLAAGDNRLDGFVKLFNPFDPKELKISAVKKAVSASHPVVIGMIAPPSLSLADEFWQPREKPDTSMAAQAFCIIGYDDQKFGGAVQIVNQWGKSWGMHGFTWIRYGDLSSFARYGYELLHRSKCFMFPETSVVLYGEHGRVIDQFPINNQEHQVAEAQRIGTKFRLSIKSQTGGFVYVLFRESVNRITPLFPDIKTYPFVTQTITLPSKVSYYELEGEPQTNDLFLIISKKEVDVSLLRSFIENGSLLKQNPSANQLEVNSQFSNSILVTNLKINQY